MNCQMTCRLEQAFLTKVSPPKFQTFFCKKQNLWGDKHKIIVKLEKKPLTYQRKTQNSKSKHLQDSRMPEKRPKKPGLVSSLKIIPLIEDFPLGVAVGKYVTNPKVSTIP